MKSETPLVLENLSFRYRDRQEPAIRDISLEVTAGELLLLPTPLPSHLLP